MNQFQSAALAQDLLNPLWSQKKMREVHKQLRLQHEAMTRALGLHRAVSVDESYKAIYLAHRTLRKIVSTLKTYSYHVQLEIIASRVSALVLPISWDAEVMLSQWQREIFHQFRLEPKDTSPTQEVANFGDIDVVLPADSYCLVEEYSHGHATVMQAKEALHNLHSAASAMPKNQELSNIYQQLVYEHTQLLTQLRDLGRFYFVEASSQEEREELTSPNRSFTRSHSPTPAIPPKLRKLEQVVEGLFAFTA